MVLRHEYMIPAGYYYTNDEQFIAHIKAIWSDNIIDLTGDDDISIATSSVNTWNAFGLINNQQSVSIVIDDDDDDTTSSTSYATEINTLEKSSSDESIDIINSDDDSSCTDDD
ncbi:uncharacterized protein LOC114128579 [Aphis gossypii]|uniref:uncharacterized protein LOC114128579 n=1 Tax=Aphis gossypii TaxID=80765 RepID=UPI00100F41CB|nr:uncharacterized protein LOC114128579 [Aphis gossypii]XP_050054093.1 uncharacterized protein LOC114128579 [Aphis gossypii]